MLLRACPLRRKNRLLRTPGYTGGTPDVLYDTRGNVTHQGTLAGQWHQQMAWDPFGMHSEHRERKADGSTTVRFFLYGPGNLRFLTGIQELPAGGPPGAIRREIDVRNQGGKVLRRWIVNGWGSGQNMVHDRDYVYDQTGPLATRLGDAQATRRYFFKDHLGTTRVVTNQHGQPDFGYQNYYPFGEEIQHPLAQVDDRLCKYTNHEREAHGQSHYMLGRHYAQNLQRFLSPDPARDGWNLYGYVGNNPLKFVDPTGLVVSLASLDEDQQAALLEGLASFTGNQYSIDDQENLQLESTGDDSSGIATTYIAGLISSEREYSVVESKDGRNRGLFETGEIQINFQSFEGADYGKVDPQTFNLGSTFVHESYHASTGIEDSTGTFRHTLDWTGPVVDFVNTIRAERGLPLRDSYNSEQGFRRSRTRLGFVNVNHRRPDKRYYVYRNRQGE